MKQLIIFGLLLSGLSAKAQPARPEFFAGIEAFGSNKIQVEDIEGNYLRYDNGDYNFMFGIRYSPLKFFTAKIETNNSFVALKATSYMPVNSAYSISGTVRLSNLVSFKAEHACYHPNLSDGRQRNKLLGGYTKFGLYYNVR